MRYIVTARKHLTDEIIDIYEYEKPLDKIGKDCLRLWMELIEFLNPKCTFECSRPQKNIKLVCKKVKYRNLFEKNENLHLSLIGE